MSLRYSTVTFLSDYGRTDEFVGVVHSVIRALSPDVRVIDLTHDIPPYDVRAGGLTLARSAQYLSAGVVVAVVDPTVGSLRRPIAVEVGDGASVLVGPDNGLLAPAVAMVGGATRAVWLNDPEYHLEAAGPTFDGRDVFAPVAAHLCNGVPLEDLGELVDTGGLMPGLMPLTREEDGGLVCEVLWVDRYGNVQLNVDPDEIDPLGGTFEVQLPTGRRSARRAHTFTDIGTGSIGLIIDSYGLIALAANQSSAAEELGLAAGDGVTLKPLDEDASPDPTSVNIQLGRTRGG
ncbi:MAG: S-adenosyl-l-methionine hydroxide adenosyltransferase family protein [Acidimicrobiales bacterium]